MKKIIPIIISLILLMPVVSACSAQIKGMTVDKTAVQSGKTVTINTNIEFHVDWNDYSWKGGVAHSCDFLVESAIVKRPELLGIQLPLSVSDQSQCCTGNNNFGSRYYTATCSATEITGCTRTETINLVINAPAKGYCDHCAGQSGNTNPSCSSSPDFYWEDAGYYLLATGVYKGCYYDLIQAGETQQQYSLRSTTIYVSENIPPPPPECGNDECEYGENWFNCSQDCPLIPGLDWTMIIWIIVFVVIIIIIVIEYKASKKPGIKKTKVK